MQIAGIVPTSLQDGLGAYALSARQLIVIARILEMPIERTDELDFFLEPFEVPQRAVS